MKPIITWIVLANSRGARVLANRGPGKGLEELKTHVWEAPPMEQPRDRAGVGHSIAGPGVAGVTERDARLIHDQGFARQIIRRLRKAQAAHDYDRLVLAAGPHMLGLLRQQLDAALKSVLVGEIAKDLTAQPPQAVSDTVGAVIAV